MQGNRLLVQGIAVIVLGLVVLFSPQSAKAGTPGCPVTPECIVNCIVPANYCEDCPPGWGIMCSNTTSQCGGYDGVWCGPETK